MVSTRIIQSERTARRPRTPTHTFQLRNRPWQIQPFMIAPVLPGETLKQMMFQARVVSDPIKNPLIGWHAEFYFFYVKHRDLSGSADYQQMMLQFGYDMTAQRAAAAATGLYHAANGIDYTNQCLQAVVKHYFRQDGELPDDYKIGSLPVANINRVGWFDNLVDTTVMVDGSGASGLTGNAQSMESVDLLQQQYEFMRANQLVNMTYEDWLRTYGVHTTPAEENKPELIRYVKEWSYPTNTVEPTTGTPTTAMSWSIAERADKDRYFKEPGFIFGVVCYRPKVYLSKQKGSMVEFLDTAFSWLPAIMADRPETSLREFANNAGPLAGNVTNGYWVDLRDLFMYGDQFLNFDHSADTTASIVALPSTAQQYKYPVIDDATNLFMGSGAVAVKADGVVNLTILGTQQDMT